MARLIDDRARAGVRFDVVPLEGSVVHADAQGATRSRRGLVVVARDDGLRGVGEASPLPGHSIETLEACAHALARSFDDDGAMPAAARFAVETALLDLAAQRAGRPLHATLAGAGGSATTRIDTQAVVAIDDDASERLVTGGARALKLKVGRDELRDVARVKRARALGPDLCLRVDANGQDVGARLEAALVAARVDFCEDPGSLDVLRPRSFPVAIDLRPDTVEVGLAAVARGDASVVVLKPTILGGLAASIEIAVRARALGARVVVSHALESPIGLAACAHLALAIGAGEIHGLGRYAGLDGFRAGGEELAVPDWIAPFGIRAPTSPGLGR